MTVSDANTPLIEVKDLGIRLNTSRGPAQAVRGVSFALRRGETLGLVGESGCGKSITALALMGLLPDSAVVSGSIRLEGSELVGLPDASYCKLRGNRISMIFQEPMTALNPMHTIGRQVAEPLRRHTNCSAAQAHEQAIALLDRVGLPDAAKRAEAYPHQFSGGQRQRVTIAMALACQPDVLIADEPTTALDVTIQAQILDLLMRERRDNGMGLVLITHDMGVVAETADRVIVQYAGQQMEMNATRAMFADPHHPYTTALLAALPERANGRRLPAIPGVVPGPFDRPRGCVFSPRCAYVFDACHDAEPPPAEPALGRARCLTPLVAAIPTALALQEAAS